LDWQTVFKCSIETVTVLKHRIRFADRIQMQY